ncbi:MAG TPA: rhodanese-like domain-containing protein [Flavobacteriaceae bacterium]|nr:rhodanese-like domain-containing protein [Flavobacteriaceae bacterium]
MKELKRTRRISIAAIVTFLLIVLALLSYEKPNHNYTVDAPTTLNYVLEQDYIADLTTVEGENVQLIDVRGPYEFEKGHLPNALNIYAPEILDDEYVETIEDLKDSEKTIIVYGATPDEALNPFMILKQVGFKNVKMLPIVLTYYQNKLVISKVDLEKPVAKDIDKFIKESIKKAAEKPKPIVKKAIPKKVVVPKKKKKKMPIEGGC